MSDHPLPRDQLEALYKRAKNRVEILEKELAMVVAKRDSLTARVELLKHDIDRIMADLALWRW